MHPDPSSAGPAGTFPPVGTKTSDRLLFEDLFVTAFGVATSAAVACGSFYLAKNHGFALYTWMADVVLPSGALGCGFVAAVPA